MDMEGSSNGHSSQNKQSLRGEKMSFQLRLHRMFSFVGQLVCFYLFSIMKEIKALSAQVEVLSTQLKELQASVKEMSANTGQPPSQYNINGSNHHIQMCVEATNNVHCNSVQMAHMPEACSTPSATAEDQAEDTSYTGQSEDRNDDGHQPSHLSKSETREFNADNYPKRVQGGQNIKAAAAAAAADGFDGDDGYVGHNRLNPGGCRNDSKAHGMIMNEIDEGGTIGGLQHTSDADLSESHKISDRCIKTETPETYASGSDNWVNPTLPDNWVIIRKGKVAGRRRMFSQGGACNIRARSNDLEVTTSADSVSNGNGVEGTGGSSITWLDSGQAGQEGKKGCEGTSFASTHGCDAVSQSDECPVAPLPDTLQTCNSKGAEGERHSVTFPDRGADENLSAVLSESMKDCIDERFIGSPAGCLHASYPDSEQVSGKKADCERSYSASKVEAESKPCLSTTLSESVQVASGIPITGDHYARAENGMEKSEEASCPMLACSVPTGIVMEGFERAENGMWIGPLHLRSSSDPADLRQAGPAGHPMQLVGDTLPTSVLHSGMTDKGLTGSQPSLDSVVTADSRTAFGGSLHDLFDHRADAEFH
ncbi:uncharacterized protein LOC143298068 [Babylonia areolata]|uniref:uncharacterized protein LOC143298068 n=1 Tax=Babylonia areolata TaxID=304850 RepID=UPI003FD067F2